MPETFVHETVHQIDSAFSSDKIGKETVLKNSSSLFDLTKEFVLFSHALFFTHGFLDFDPVNDLDFEKDAFLTVDLPYPVFDGVPCFDSKLFGVVTEKWQQLSTHLANVSVFGANNMFWTSLMQEMFYYPVSTGDTKDKVPIFTFGVTGTHGLFAFDIAKYPELDNRLRVVSHPPEESILQLLTLFKENTNVKR